MKSTRVRLQFLALALVFLTSAHAQTLMTNAASDLDAQPWQLVKFEGGDGTTLTPDDKTKYTIAFEADGHVSARIDCNRGRGTWRSAGPNQLEFGPLALTRAMCPPGSLHDQIAKQWQYVRSYTLKDGHLFLALMADGGIYEYEPMSPEGTKGGVVKGTATYRERIALPPGTAFEATLEDISKADAPSEVIGRARIEHPGNPPISFEITYDPAKIAAGDVYSIRGRITDGDRVLFTTTRGYPVLTRGNGNEVKLLLQRSAGNVGESTATQTTISSLPATFVGTLPCADCPGILYQVNLFPDHTFSSRMTYEGRTTYLDDRGSWQFESTSNALVLHGGGEAPQKFAVPDGDTLRKLDTSGHEIVSKLNYDLKRAPTFTPIESPSQETAKASLENTYWKLIQLGDEPVNVASEQKAPYFVLNPVTGRVNGSGGCNRLVGSYTLDGDHLTFGQTAGTMMACPEGMETERAFLQALPQVNSWKISAQRLELFDTSGKRIASFEARQMK